MSQKRYIFQHIVTAEVDAYSEEEARQKLEARFATTFDDFQLIDVRDA